MTTIINKLSNLTINPHHSILVTTILACFVISCTYLVSLCFSFALFQVELLNKLSQIAFGSLWLVHSKFKHWMFGTIPNDLQFKVKF